MKKIFPILFTILYLCSCTTKLAPQDPSFKLSEEHGKMLNLILNLAQFYSDKCIEYDTSSDNYICNVYYSDFESKSVKSISIYHIKYCNGVITDICTYNYENGVTYSTPNSDTHVRWNDSSITVRKYGKLCRYMLNNPNCLKTSSTDWFVVPAAEIRKIDDDNYFYRRQEMKNTLFATEYDGDNYIEYDTVEGEKKIFQVLRIWNKDQKKVCRFYLDGCLKMDNQYRTGYFFQNTDLTEGYRYHFDKDKNELHDSIKRKYDELGRLVYEELLREDGFSVVTIISKSIPDVREFSKNLSKPIDIENAVVEKD